MEYECKKEARNDIDESLLQKDILHMLDNLGIKQKLKGYQFIKELVLMKLLDKLYGEEERQVRTLVRILEEKYNDKIQDKALKYSINSAWDNEYLRKLYDNKIPGMAKIINVLVKEFYKQNIIVTYNQENNNKIYRACEVQ